MSRNASLRRDANRAVYGTEFVTEKVVTFTGAAGLGAVGTVDLFNTSGAVQLNVFGICEVGLAGATATLDIAFEDSAGFFSSDLTATNVLADEIIAGNNALQYSNGISATRYAVKDGSKVISNIGTANITAGRIRFVAYWSPFGDNDGYVQAA